MWENTSMVLLLQTQPRPHSSNNPLWSTVLFRSSFSLWGDVLTCQLGHQRSHQVHLVEVGSDLNKYIHVFYHQLLQSEQETLARKDKTHGTSLSSLLRLPCFPRGWTFFPGPCIHSTFSSTICESHATSGFHSGNFMPYGPKSSAKAPHLWR